MEGFLELFGSVGFFASVLETASSRSLVGFRLELPTREVFIIFFRGIKQATLPPRGGPPKRWHSALS